MGSRPGSPLPYATNIRLSAAQYAHLVLMAAKRGTTISAAIRQAVEREIDAQPGLEGDMSLTWRAFVSMPGLDLTEAVEQLQEDEDEPRAQVSGARSARRA